MIDASIVIEFYQNGSFGENNGLYFECQILISGFSTYIKIRNCAWATEWSEWRTL